VDNACQNRPQLIKWNLYLQYAKLEEDYGLAKRAMKVYDQATKAVPNNQKLSMYEIYIARAAELERSLGEVERARGVYVFASTMWLMLCLLVVIVLMTETSLV